MKDKKTTLNELALRALWRRTPSEPQTTEAYEAHELRKSRILKHISRLEKQKVRPFWKQRKYAAAASFAACFFVIGYFIYNTATTEPTSYSYSSKHTSRTIKLPDSTLVTLAPHSTLSWQQSDSDFNRQVALTGKAKFAVTRKTAKKFTVKTAQMKVWVLGTVFTVNDFNGRKSQEVSVDEGKVSVEVSNLKENKTHILKAGQQLSQRDGKTTITNLPTALSGPSVKRLKLESSTLEQFAQQLAAMYQIEVYVSPSIRQSGAITAEFEDMELSQILMLVSKTIKIEYKIEADKIRISPKE